MHSNYKIVLLFVFGYQMISFSQTGHGFAFDNYSGIYGLAANPANSVDSKYDIHVNVMSYNQLGISEAGVIPYFEIETAHNGFNGLVFNVNDASEVNASAMGHSDILLPSVLWDFHENFAAGLLTRSRTFYDYNNVNGLFLKSVNGAFPENDFEFNNTALNNTALSWTEVGLNLSAVLLNSNYHFVKFGGTLKYYLGKGGNELRGNLSGSYVNGNNTLGLSGNLINLDTFDPATNSSDATSKSFASSAFDFQNKGSGFGGDIGLVYEWRPRETNRVDVRSNSSAVNKYKLKISASVLDVGTIKFESAQRNAYQISGATINASNFSARQGLINLLNEEISNGSVTNDPTIGEVEFALPMSLHLNIDYILLNNKNIYLNLNYIKALNTISDPYTNTQRDIITVTPRYETRKLSIYLPVNFESTSSTISAGIGLRYGPVTVGTAALSNMLTNHKMRHLYFGLSIPLMKELYR